MYRCLSIAAVIVLMWSSAALGDGLDGTEISETQRGLVVKAGAPGSLTLSHEPGRGGGGAVVYCGWYHFSVEFGVHLFDPIGDSVWPQPGSTYLLNCWRDSPDFPIPGYPTITQYRWRGEVPGPVVSSVDAARFAVANIDFEQPVIELSPPSRQVVGVPTWLAVTSRLSYGQVSANAGPVWATVRASFRDVTWDLGNGASRVCTTDATKLWDRANPQAPASRCSYTYTNSSGSPFNVRATVRWDIEQSTNEYERWRPWGTISRSSTARVPVAQLQASIR